MLCKRFKRIEVRFLVTDGGTVVVGGVIQTQNSVAIFQVPPYLSGLAGAVEVEV